MKEWTIDEELTMIEEFFFRKGCCVRVFELNCEEAVASVRDQMSGRFGGGGCESVRVV